MLNSIDRLIQSPYPQEVRVLKLSERMQSLLGGMIISRFILKRSLTPDQLIINLHLESDLSGMKSRRALQMSLPTDEFKNMRTSFKKMQDEFKSFESYNCDKLVYKVRIFRKYVY